MNMRINMAGARSAYEAIFATSISQVTPEMAHSLRAMLEQEVEERLALLDAIDGDPDLEPSLGDGSDDREGDVQDEPHDEIDEDGREDDDPAEDSDHSGCGDPGGMTEQCNGEYSLGATEDFNHDFAWEPKSSIVWACPEGEPSLGWTERHGVGWSRAEQDSPQDDREDDAGDGGEMDEDREPSLGSVEIGPEGSQQGWARSDRNDTEQNGDEEDISGGTGRTEDDPCFGFGGLRRAPSDDVLGRLRAIQRRRGDWRPARDPDTMEPVGPGVGRVLWGAFRAARAS